MEIRNFQIGNIKLIYIYLFIYKYITYSTQFLCNSSKNEGTQFF